MKTPKNIPPGPRFGNLNNFIQLGGDKRLEWIQESYKKYGDTFRAKIYVQDLYITRDPEIIKEVLQNTTVFGKHSSAFKALAKIGNGLFISEGEYWFKHRKIAQPLFHKAHLLGYNEEMLGAIRSQLAELKKTGQTKIELTEWIDRIILEITIRCIYGVVPEQKMIDRICEMGNYFMKAIHQFIKFNDGISDSLLFFLYPTFKKKKMELDAMADEIIRLRRQNSLEEPVDMLGVLINMHDTAPDDLSAEQIRNEIITFLFAGFITTSHSISWTFHALLQDKALMDQVEDYVQPINFESITGIESNAEVDLLRRVFYESIRLYPPIPIIPRRVRETIQVGPYTIPKSSEVYMDIYGLHRNTAYWENETTFDPARFDSSQEKKIQNMTYLPWGGGMRKCIGVSFSIQEAVMVIGEVFKTLSIQPKYTSVEKYLTITMSPKSLPVQIKWK